MSATATLQTKSLSVREARTLLERPIFGDERSICAAKMLSALEESAELVGRTGEHHKYPCPCCEAGGRRECECCGRDMDCHQCGGAGYIGDADIDYLSYDEVQNMRALALRESAHR